MLVTVNQPRALQYLFIHVTRGHEIFTLTSSLRSINLTVFSGGSRPSDKGGPVLFFFVLFVFFFWPFGPQFGLKIKGGGPSGPLP